ncbi:MAG: DUF4465 domain-containing protein [Muribaculaceae bacterium]|nr:DUF4465 domain-containing protein [Muribaculaceae bacterium]
MKQLRPLSLLVLLMMMCSINVSAREGSTTNVTTGATVYLPTSDGLCDIYIVDGTITFKATSASSLTNYRDNGVAFKPANEGEKIVITVNSIDISGGTHLIMYDGNVDYTKIGTSGAGGASPYTYFPTGWVKEILQGQDEGYSFTSTTDNGVVAFGCTTRGVTGMTGWDITVSSVSPKDMEYVSCSVITPQAKVNRGAKKQAIFGVDVVMDGGSNPITLDEVKIDASALSASSQVSNVRLYKGESYTADALLATATTVGDELIATNVDLKSGHNKIMVVADILADASGTIPSLSLESVKVGGEARTADATTGTGVEIENTVIIADEAMTYTIGEVTNFYDDGGKDANYTRDFEGVVTFVPATEGQSIKIDFTKLDLFDATLDTNDDVFKFYNGREVNEANLITSLLTESEIVKSTADDGSMTVYFKTVTGYPKSGWEATVSQFLPGNMTLAGVSGEAASTATVSAGDTDAQMLVIDVATDNTANPLSLKGINLTAADAKNISRARAYYLGKKNTFATTDKFGEVEVSGTTIAITGEKDLIEGHNYVAIVLDINNGAQNEEQITLSLNDVTVGETTQAPANAVSATRTVNNVCRATQGAHSHVISGPWTFTHTEGYSGKYETVDADYVVTFTPAEAGTVAEIDFSSFDVYYSTSSYSTRAVFEIYSGTEVSADKLLWNLKDNSESKVGPGKVLRSQSADGSLTIRFNPKTTSSYYAGTGWTAIVKPFQNHDMSVKNITVNQTSSDVLAVGATGAELIDFNLETEGTLSLMTVKDINLDLKNTQAAISKVSVFYNNTNDRASAVEFGAVENPEASAITVSGERELAEGNNYWWVNVDIKADAAAESVVDAKLVSIVDAAGTTTTIENGDPEGNRVVKYIYLMQEGNNIVTVTEPLLFYDDGGADGKLTKGFKGTVTFVPGRDNSAVQINTLNTFSIGSGKMMIYSGREANEENILGKITGYSTTTGPANLVSKAEDGSMTVVFEANSSASTLDGWEMEVSLHEKTPFTIEAIDVANTTDDVMRNSQDNVMQQLKLNVSGDKDPIALSSVAFNATGNVHIANAKVYYTEHNAVFSTNTLLGSVTVADGENTLSLDEPLEITDNGDYYLWLTYDIATDATVGTAVTAQITKVGDTDVTATAASRNIKAGLKGNYIIGASDNAYYHTFAEATEALQGGVEGAVTFQVEDGTYNENLWFASVPGVSAANTVTFTSLSGNRDNVIIAGAGSSEYMPGSSSYKKGVVFIDNTPYVTLDKLSFVPAKESEYSYVVQIYDRSHHFTLSDCHVKATPVLSGYSGINLVKMSAVNEDGRNNDFATFENNLLEGGYIALYLGGTNNVSLSKEQGLVVRGNTISEAGSKGIYIYDEINTVVENNVISQSTVQKTGYWGIDIARNRGNVVVSGNKINNSTTYYSGGIQLRGETFGTPEVPVKVYNNAISIINSPSNSTAGIEIDLDQKYIDVVNNTVRIAGNGGYTFYTARRTPIAYEGIKLQNNLLQNTTSSPAMFIISGYNDKPSMINNALWGETVMEGTTIDALNEMAGNSGNITEQADFMSDVDLHLKSAGNLCMGLPVDYITTDADGLSRNAETPTVGAYEFAEVVEQKPEIAEGYPIVNDVTETTATIKSKWTVGGKLYYMVEEVTEPTAGAPALKVVTADDLKATEGVDITADTEVSTALADLTPATTYKAYLMVVSALGVESDVVETEQFTTLRHIEPLTATLDKVAATISAGETATITAVVAGGDEPYTYEWRDQMNQVVGNEATLSVAPEYSYGYRLTVTSADGQTVNAKTGVRVLGEAVAASMDDNYLDEDSHWAYDSSTASMITDGFYSGSYYFNNGAMPSYNYWYGYSLSNETSTAYASLADQWHSAVGEGHNGSSNYCVAFPEGQFVEITNSVDGDNLRGVYVSNSAYSFNGMANGDGYARAFKQDDWFKLTAVGFDANNTETARVDFYLADYRSTNSLDHYILDTWQWMDLRPLGKVAKVRFLLDGTDKGNYGLNTAAYFVMDDFNCERDMTQATCVVKLGESTINLRDYVVVDDNGSTMVFTLEDAGAVVASAGVPALKDITTDAIDIALDENGILNINAKVDLSAHKVLVGLTQQGKTQWVELTVKVDNNTAIDGIIVENGKMVENRQYINVAGQVSDHPFNGLNIIVTRYTDGSTTSVKKIF